MQRVCQPREPATHEKDVSNLDASKSRTTDAPGLSIARAAEMALFELRDASLVGAITVLRGADWSVAESGVTAIVGPAGTGKSVLLATLAGARPEGFRLSGSWSARGAALGRVPITHVPQRRHRDGRGTSDELARALETAHPLLIDEPESHVDGSEREALLRGLAARTAASLLVSHDLDLVRSVATRTMLLCAGAIVSDAPTAEFFEHPSSELAARFVRDGNCWPRATPPVLPPSFRWIVPGRLAGVGRPGLSREADDDLAAMASAGIGLLVSLTEEPFPTARLRAFGIEGAHLPIRDMDVPPLARAADVCKRVERSIHAGVPAAIHCHAGLGRTGTMLAAYLVWTGDDAATALARVRAAEPRMVQNAAQERFIGCFAETFGRPS